jgi:hypothetical protein
VQAWGWSSAPPHKPPYVKAEWLEKTVWDDVRSFLENPGEVLERVREQMGDEGEAERSSKGVEETWESAWPGRSATCGSAQGHISEDELRVYLADLKNQIGNLRLLLQSVGADLSQHAEKREIAQTTSAWLAPLRERISEVEAETEEAYRTRRQLVELLVAGVTIGRREDGEREIRITYRFGLPTEPNAEFIAEGMFVSSMENTLS